MKMIPTNRPNDSVPTRVSSLNKVPNHYPNGNHRQDERNYYIDSLLKKLIKGSLAFKTLFNFTEHTSLKFLILMR